MRRFQVIFAGGLVQNIEADNYRVVRHKVVFRTDGQPVSTYPKSNIIMIDEVDGADVRTSWPGPTIPALQRA
jgi:hypothetical protein